MELRQIRQFVGVCEAGSLLKASAQLHIAQPALGQHITALEHDLQAQLFQRSSRGMRLTDAGRQFLEHAKVLLADAERARLAVQAHADLPQGEVAIGLPATVALAVTLPLLKACRARFPQIRLQIVEAYSGFLSEWLRLGRLDAAVVFGDHNEAGLLKTALLDEQLALVTPRAARPLPARVGLKRLSRVPLILPSRGHGLRRIIDEACAAESVPLDVVAEIDSLTAAQAAVEAGIAATVLSIGSVAEAVRAGRVDAATISHPLMSRRVVSAIHLTRPGTRASAAVVALLSEVVCGMVRSGAWPGRLVAQPESARLRERTATPVPARPVRPARGKAPARPGAVS